MTCMKYSTAYLLYSLDIKGLAASVSRVPVYFHDNQIMHQLEICTSLQKATIIFTAKFNKPVQYKNEIKVLVYLLTTHKYVK